MVRASARRLAVLGRALLPPAPLPAAEAGAGAEAAPDGGVLTAQQCEHFRTFGFLVLRQAIRPDELEAVSDEFAAGLARKDPTDLIAGVRQQLNWTNLDEHSPKIQALLEDRRFYGAAQQLLGDDVIGFDSNCNYYSGDRSPWHPDVGSELVGLKVLSAFPSPSVVFHLTVRGRGENEPRGSAQR